MSSIHCSLSLNMSIHCIYFAHCGPFFAVVDFFYPIWTCAAICDHTSIENCVCQQQNGKQILNENRKFVLMLTRVQKHRKFGKKIYGKSIYHVCFFAELFRHIQYYLDTYRKQNAHYTPIHVNGDYRQQWFCCLRYSPHTKISHICLHLFLLFCISNRCYHGIRNV